MTPGEDKQKGRADKPALTPIGAHLHLKHRPQFFGVRQALSSRADSLIGLLGIAIVVGLWCYVTYGGHIKPVFLPTPSAMWESIQEFDQRHWLIPAIVNSTIRVAKSLVLVTLIGVPIGLLMGAFSPVDALLRKLVSGGKSIPTTGIAGLIVLWFSIDESAKIVFLFLGSIFYMIILVRSAVLSVNEDYIKVAQDLGATRLQTIWRVLLPAALPAIWDAMAVCNGIMWTYIVLAEFINSSEDQLGLGYLLMIGSRTQDSGKVFSTLIIVAIISSLSDWVMQTIRKRYFNW